jgi:hypothetical protein
MSIPERKLSGTRSKVTFGDEKFDANRILGGSSSAELYLLPNYAGREVIVKIPLASRLQELKDFTYRPDVDFTISDFCTSVLLALEKAGILLLDPWGVRDVNELDPSPRTIELPSVAFLQKFEDWIWDPANHTYASLPLLGPISGKDFAKNPTTGTEVLFDWDSILSMYFRRFRTGFQSLMDSPSQLGEFAGSISAEKRDAATKKFPFVHDRN